MSSEGEFGANEWLVDELYEQFKVDKNSVDKSWWPILEAYQPVRHAGERRPSVSAPTSLGRQERRSPAPEPASSPRRRTR